MSNNPLAIIRNKITSPGFARLITEAAPAHLRGDNLAQRVAYSLMYSMSQNQRLAACTPESLQKLAIDSVSIGLIPGGPLGQAYPVPFGREATLIVGYRGLMELARRGGVARIDARIVYDGDEFEVVLGNDARVVHKPTYKNRGEMYAVYAIANSGNGQQFEVMTIDEINKVRQRSRAKDSGPWVTDFEEMARKTVVRRLCKYLPMSVDMARAIEIDARTDTGSTHAVLDAELAETADQTPKDAAQELADSLPDVTPAATEEPAQTNGKRQCPTCGDWFQRLGAHKCPHAAQVAQDDDFGSAYQAATQKHDPAHVHAVLDALAPGWHNNWEGDTLVHREAALMTAACDILVDTNHPPTPDQMSVFVDLVRTRVEA